MTPYKNIRFYGLLILLLLLGVVLASQPIGKRTRAQDRENYSAIKPIQRIEDLRIVNKTTGFSVVEIKKLSDTLFELTYKNDYSKSITGFEVSIGGMRVQTELILGGDEHQFISPGNTFSAVYTAQLGLEKHGIQILAVVFDDGSGDGEIRYVKEITDYRLGIRAERQRLLPLLNRVITSKDENILTVFEELETDISSAIPSTRQDGPLDNVGLGVRNERRRMLEEIRMLKQKHWDAHIHQVNAHQLKEDLRIVKGITENIIKLSSTQ